ncbi:MAG: MvaI/BcnI family restriction endonuclease [Candidatus Kapaibacterium sp.]
MKIFSKQELINELIKISRLGWIKNNRSGNQGGIGNTLEDLLGIEENNLPIPNASEWELKTQRRNTSSLTTLFHMEPSPRALRVVPNILLPLYGWRHKEAGKKYALNEMSFRQTIGGKRSSDRGFQVVIDRSAKKIKVTFNPDIVDNKHNAWLNQVIQNTRNAEFIEPYWGFRDLSNKAGTKLLNCFYIEAEVKKINKEEYFKYSRILMLENFEFDKFLKALEENNILIDFDARTGHNHGTKFRLRRNHFEELYKTHKQILDLKY